MLKVGFHTLGCKVNQYETEAIMELFEQRGYEIVDFEANADVYVINTCTVTNIADKKSRKMLSKAKSVNSDAVIVALGCYAQIAGNQLSENPDIDLIIGSTKKTEVVDRVEQYLKDRQKINIVEDMTHQNQYEALWVSKNEDKKRAHIKIQDGCNQFCSYCIIPYTRGRVRSREAESVLEEVRAIVLAGYKEIVLTGIHLASYGLEFTEYKLIDLLEALDKVEGLQRIRLGSLEPTLITEEFVSRLAMLHKICPHFHLSLQSGCDATLKRMNRKYTTDAFWKSVALLRESYDRPSITTDIIVGFPGETDAEFEATKDFATKIAFSEIHIFKFSKRQGTVAAQLKDQVKDSLKTERSKTLSAIRDQGYKLYMKQFIGETIEVLFENLVEVENHTYYMGHAANYLKIIVPLESENLEKRLLKVQLQSICEPYIQGILVE